MTDQVFTAIVLIFLGLMLIALMYRVHRLEFELDFIREELKIKSDLFEHYKSYYSIAEKLKSITESQD